MRIKEKGRKTIVEPVKDEELKTLKDISAPSLWYQEEIRKEAIKWVKHLAESEQLEDNDKVNWIMHFFNITEEELENGT